MINIVQLDFNDLQAAIKSCVKEAINEFSESPKRQELPDCIGLKEAVEITGYKQSTLYSLTTKKAIPYKKLRDGRLVFSRKELTLWMEQQTVRKQSPEEIATAHLAKEARKKLNKSTK
jgi:predicted DNA-binding transcriptional regulator AlpA